MSFHVERTEISLVNMLQVEMEPGMLDYAMRKVAQQTGAGRTKSVEIHVMERDKSGWLEWPMIVKYADGGQLVLGLLQRQPGEGFESHS